MISFFAPGQPAAQGSKTYLGKGRMIEGSKKLKPFRAVVTLTAREAMGNRPLMTGPVAVEVVFKFVRPKSHFGSGKNSDVLRDDAPDRPIGHNLGDVDKLQRSVLDAMTGAVFLDDSQVASIEAHKVWADSPGAWIQVEAVRDTIAAMPGPF